MEYFLVRLRWEKLSLKGYKPPKMSVYKQIAEQRIWGIASAQIVISATMDRKIWKAIIALVLRDTEDKREEYLAISKSYLFINIYKYIYLPCM